MLIHSKAACNRPVIESVEALGQINMIWLAVRKKDQEIYGLIADARAVKITRPVPMVACICAIHQLMDILDLKSADYYINKCFHNQTQARVVNFQRNAAKY